MYFLVIEGWGMETKKNGGSILSSIGWICVALLTLLLMPPYFMFLPICIGVVLRRDYQERKQEGLAMIISGIIGTIIGVLLGIYVNLNVL